MKFGIMGFSGKMGKEIVETFQESGHTPVLKVDDSHEVMDGVPEIMMDFSRPEALDRTLKICETYSCPLVIGTTGFGEKEMAKLKALSKHVGIVQSYNFSIGINVMLEVIKNISPSLSEWDVEIIEMHHSTKKDKPSGTAIMIKDLLKDAPVHSLRIGGLPGDHKVIFANGGEVLEISHRAISRKAFAIGALKAAEWVMDKKPNFYNFSDVMHSKRA
ncbi:4-hydroxy-tetrahydrodipicolinate reductase [Athalassotoga sp.]|uniref:4-hydroxy-tetrahydrodipicolinate reductase n=1 Tax=Athalassotoga sp. TaxID=2022597 RepID=UPI003D03D515